MQLSVCLCISCALFYRFNDKMRLVMEGEPWVSMTSRSQSKHLLDYLFLVWKPGGVFYTVWIHYIISNSALQDHLQLSCAEMVL